ncbi:MAG: cupin domain-containing protein [Acidimicrobiales bacterium]
MTEDEFGAKLSAAGYGEPTTKVWEANADGEFHTHDFSALLMVTDGEFRVVLEDETKVLKSGDWCEVVAGTVHCEQTGANGATVVAGTR